MAPRFSRRRRDRSEAGDDAATSEEDTRLDAEEHAWWAQREIEEVWTPREEPEPDAPPPRDVLAEHFGEDWRTSFGFDPTVAPPPEDEGEPIDTSDPYAVLEVDSAASWDAIVDAHRRMARRHHPDRLVGRSDAEIRAGENRIRLINAAYAELRVRRGK
jgi:DnaJ-domain-containing protein 1